MSFTNYDDLMMNVRSVWSARIILTAIELNVADVLAKGDDGEGLSGKDVATKLQGDARATTMLLDAMTALGLAEKHEDKYKNSQLAKEKFVTSSPNYGGDGLWHMAHLWQSWSQLTDCIRTGKPARTGERTEEQYHQFVGAMYDYGLVRAKALAKSIDLTGVKRLIDIGGGPGSYAISFCEANEGLEATVFDRPPAIHVARQKIAKHKIEEQVKVVEGDIYENDLGNDWEVAFASHIIHAYGPEESKTFFEKVHGSLVSGGRFLLQDFFAEDDRVSPPNVPVFSINMLVNTPNGQTFTFSETEQWLKEVGFTKIKRLATPPGADVIEAFKA